MQLYLVVNNERFYNINQVMAKILIIIGFSLINIIFFSK